MPAKIPPMPVPNPPSKSLLEVPADIHEQVKAEALVAGIHVKRMTSILLRYALDKLASKAFSVESPEPTYIEPVQP